MRYQSLSAGLLGALVLLVGLWPFSSYAEDQEIEGEGKAKIFAGNTNGAREEAIRTALKEVIKNASALLMGEELYKAKSNDVAKRVLATYKRYINWHGIVSENTTSSEVSVRVRASVSLDKLRSDLGPLLGAATDTKASPVAKKALLLSAPIPPEEFAKDPAERKPAPEAPEAISSLQEVLQAAGYEVAQGGAIGPSDDAAAIAARTKAAGAQMALVISPVGGPLGDVSVTRVSCAQVTVRAFLYLADGQEGGKLSYDGASCDADAQLATRNAAGQASAGLSELLRKDSRIGQSGRRRVKIVGIPSFSALELVSKSLKDLGGKGVELVGVEGGEAVFAIPSSAPQDIAERVVRLLGKYAAASRVVEGTPVVEILYTRILAEGVTDEKTLSFLTDTLAKLPGVTEVSAPPLPKPDGTVEIWVWGKGTTNELADAISAADLLGRSLTATAKVGRVIQLVVGPSRLGEGGF